MLRNASARADKSQQQFFVSKKGTAAAISAPMVAYVRTRNCGYYPKVLLYPAGNWHFGFLIKIISKCQLRTIFSKPAVSLKNDFF